MYRLTQPSPKEREQIAAISRLAFSLGEGARRADEVTKGDISDSKISAQFSAQVSNCRLFLPLRSRRLPDRG